MVDLHYSPADCCYRLGLSIRVSMFEHVDRGLGPLPRSPGMGEGGDWYSRPRGDIVEGNFQGVSV